MVKDVRMMDSTKLLYHMDRVIKHFDNGERVAPIHIDMGIAKFCNIKCLYCYGFKQQPAPVFIERLPLIRFVEDAADIGVKSLAFIGDGDPTCNPHMYTALILGKNLGLDLAISTNGVLLNNEHKIRSVLESCKWMRFCLSAGTREGYQKIHGKDYFDIVKKNIELAVEIKHKYGYTCEIGLQSVFVPIIMADEMVKESEFAVKTGVDYFVIKQCSLPDKGESGMVYFDVNEYDKDYVTECLLKCESLSTEKTQIIPKWNVIKQKGFKPYNNCPSIPLISEISGNGDWYPCGFMFGEDSKFKSEYRFGNIQEQSLKEIFESDRYWDIIKKMRYDFDNKKMCQGACRQDLTNKFVADYLNKPKGINFI
jgi:radical SAM protein with 4Fe4S-binding SPASM domain